MFRDDAVAVRSSGEVVRVTVEAHVEPEPRQKRQRVIRETYPLTVVSKYDYDVSERLKYGSEPL